MDNKKPNRKTKLIVEIFDSMFIMILCFLTLLTAMLIQGGNSVLTYVIDVKTLAITITGLVVYLTFVLRQSDKGLQKLTNHIYKTEEPQEFAESPDHDLTGPIIETTEIIEPNEPNEVTKR